MLDPKAPDSVIEIKLGTTGRIDRVYLFATTGDDTGDLSKQVCSVFDHIPYLPHAISWCFG